MILRLNGLAADCIIGERPDERDRLQRLTVDVELEIGETAATSDELSDTVDYAALAERIRAALVAAEAKMIERAAALVCDVAAAERGVRRVRAAVTKAGAVPGLASATAILERKVS